MAYLNTSSVFFVRLIIYLNPKSRRQIFWPNSIDVTIIGKKSEKERRKPKRKAKQQQNGELQKKTMILCSGFSIRNNVAHFQRRQCVAFPFASPKYRLFVAILSTDRPVYVSSYRSYGIFFSLVQTKIQFRLWFVCFFMCVVHFSFSSSHIHKHSQFDALHNIDLTPIHQCKADIHRSDIHATVCFTNENVKKTR